MKCLALISFLMTATQVSLASTKTIYLDDILSKIKSKDSVDLMQVMKQVKFQPAHNDEKTGKQAFQITHVEKGSIYEKEGVKVGDLLVNGHSPAKDDAEEDGAILLNR